MTLSINLSSILRPSIKEVFKDSSIDLSYMFLAVLSEFVKARNCPIVWSWGGKKDKIPALTKGLFIIFCPVPKAFSKNVGGVNDGV